MDIRRHKILGSEMKNFAYSWYSKQREVQVHVDFTLATPVPQRQDREGLNAMLTCEICISARSSGLRDPKSFIKAFAPKGDIPFTIDRKPTWPHYTEGAPISSKAILPSASWRK